MKRVLLLVVLLGGCEAAPEMASVTSALTAEELVGTWQAGRATLALTPTGDYTYVAPNGGIVGFAQWSVEGNTLRRHGFPDSEIVLSGDTMALTTPNAGSTPTVALFTRIARYCVPTQAMQSCQ